MTKVDDTVTEIRINIPLRYIHFLVHDEVVASMPLDRAPMTVLGLVAENDRKKRKKLRGL